MTETLTYQPGHAGRRLVDLATLIRTRMLVQSNSGGGKSWAVRQLLEETHGRVQHLVLDPEGEFATLRERFDYVLAAKTGGDVLASVKTAKLLARRLMELGASAVIDIYDLPLRERREFVKLFLTELVNLPRALWHPTLVVVDEAHTFAPERGHGEAESLDAMIALASLGRKRGYCAVFATQRISKLHKDAAAELNNKLIGRTGLDVDVKRAGDELGFDKDGRRALMTLAGGEFFAFGPAIAPTVTKVRTGAVVTTHPEPGAAAPPPPPAPAKVKALLAELQDLPQQAEAEARTLEELRAANARLQAELRRAQKAQPAPVVDDAMIAARVSAAVEKARAASQQELRRALTKELVVLQRGVEVTCNATTAAVQRANQLQSAVLALQALVSPHGGAGPASDASREAPARVTDPPLTARRAPVAPRTTAPTTDLKKGQQKILDALAEMEALGIEAPGRTQLGLFASYNLTGGTGAQHIADLAKAGLVDVATGTVRLTEAGRAVASPARAPESVRELHDRVLAKVSSGQQKILTHLLDIYPAAISRRDLGEAVGYNLTGGTGAQHVADLVAVGAVVIPGPGAVSANPLLFPEGLR